MGGKRLATSIISTPPFELTEIYKKSGWIIHFQDGPKASPTDTVYRLINIFASLTNALHP
jgi:hypothetical protein